MFRDSKNAIASDDSLFASRADEAGLTAQQYRENLRLRMEAEQAEAFRRKYESRRKDRRRSTGGIVKQESLKIHFLLSICKMSLIIRIFWTSLTQDTLYEMPL